MSTPRENGTPIHQLPNELVIEIFNHIYSSLGLHRPAVEAVVGWAKLLHVCYRWREIIYATPKFWRVVDVHDRTGWLKLCLSRSIACGNAYVDVYFNDPSFPSSDLSIISEPQNVSLLRRLSVQSGPVTDGWVDGLRNLFSEPLPNLRSLRVAGELWKPMHGDIGLSAQRLPRLQELTLVSALPPSDLSLYSNLRSLTISSLNCTIPFVWITSILAACTNLEELELSGALSRLSHVPSVPGHLRGPRFALPRLRALRFDEPPPRTACVLAHLILPAVTNIDLRGHLNHVGNSSPETLSTFLPPDRSATIPFLPAISTVSFGFNGKNCLLRGESDAHDVVRLELHSSTEVFGRFTGVGLRNLAHIFSDSPVTSFTIDANLENVGLNPEDIRAALDAFPHLTSLKVVVGPGTFRHLWTTLSLPSAETESPLVCPRLKSLALSVRKSAEDCGARFSEDAFFRCIVDTLSARDALGSRIDRLEIKIARADVEEQLDTLDRRYLDELKGLVADLSYERWDGALEGSM